MKKFLMVILQLPLITVAETEIVDGIIWTYTVNSEKSKVSIGRSGSLAISSSTVGAVAIPPTLGGMAVTSIGSGAFCGCKGVTSVTIPEGVTSIGDVAFKDCQGLQSVLIPSSVTTIGGDAFYGCKQLKSVDVPDSVNAIGPFAFAHCTNLMSISLSSRLTTLSDMLFLDCSSLSSVAVPSNVVHIGKGAFYGCAVLNSVVLPESLRTIGDSAFAGFGAFSISKTMMVTEQQPVYDGHGVQIGEESVSTPVTAFEGGNLPACTNLSEIVIPVGVERVGDYAFRGCVGLKSIVIPSSVKDIGDYAFALSYWDDGIEKVVEMVAQPIIDENGMQIGVESVPVERILRVCPGRMVGNAQLEAIDIPCGVEHIGECAFLGCEAIKKVSLPKTVTSVGRNAFSGCAGLMELRLDGFDVRLEPGICACFGPVTNHIEYGHSITPSGIVVPIIRSLIISCGAACTNLSSVIIGSGVESLGADSFNGCDRLKFVTVEDGIRSIGERAFKDCRSLEKLHLPGSLIDVGENVFDGCCSLFDIAVPCALLRRQGVWALPSYQMLTNLIITGHGEMVADFGFRECTFLQSVEMVEGISGVDGYAFEGCGALQRVVLPSSCSMIGYGAFRACGSLQEMHIHGDAPDVADEAFFGTPRRLKFVVDEGTIGWTGGLTGDLPETWFGREIVYSGSEGCEGGGDEGQGSEDRPMLSALQIVTTNVVIHYVLNSVQPQFALPPNEETGLVNVMTEVKGGAIVIPESWTANYPDFTAKFGGDFSKAMTAKTGKKDGAGNEMLVWQDYVAGTNPTDETDVFTASITIMDGKVTISYTPELDGARKAMRKYTTWGKKSLMDTNWMEVQEGHEAEYNFFKVSVEMR